MLLASPEFWLFAGNTVTATLAAAVTIFTLIYKQKKAAATVAEKVDTAASAASAKLEAQTATLRADNSEVKTIVNGERAALVARVVELEKLMEHVCQDPECLAELARRRRAR